MSDEQRESGTFWVAFDVAPHVEIEYVHVFVMGGRPRWHVRLWRWLRYNCAPRQSEEE